MTFWPQDWTAILVPDAPLAELLVRATAIYWFLYLLMRLAGRRLLSQLAMSDMLVMLLLAVAVREGITGEHYTIGDGVICGVTIVAWNMIIDRLAFHFEWLRKPLRHSPIPIIQDGALLVENARDQLLTRQEIMQRLRNEGLTSIGQVRAAHMEPDGSFSVVPL